jgi:hypothetical protein
MRSPAFLACLCPLVWPIAQPAVAADSETQGFTVKAYSQAVCTLALPEINQATNMTMDGGSAMRIVVSAPTLVNEKTAQLQPGSISLTTYMVCNRPHSLQIVSGKGGLRPQSGGDTPAMAGFANRIDYSVRASWGAAAAQLQTSGVAGAATPDVQSPGAYAGNLVLQVSIDESGAGHLPLSGGNYTDGLTITLSPRF